MLLKNKLFLIAVLMKYLPDSVLMRRVTNATVSGGPAICMRGRAQSSPARGVFKSSSVQSLPASRSVATPLFRASFARFAAPSARRAGVSSM